MWDVDAIAAAAAGLSAPERVELLRHVLARYGGSAPGSPSVDASANGYVVYASDVNTQECTSWLLAPGTNLSNTGFLGFAYFIGLIYLFLGLAIISDIFMAAIERITSIEVTRRYVDGSGQRVTCVAKLINPTIANLTLMALGSSAPEILLAIIGGIATLDEAPDELGPSTIVGSAAFNLLVISAICISALPDGEQKRIADLHVFLVTAFFSIVAYLWLFFALQVTSPDVVELWEAVFTLVLFVLLLVSAYLTDVRGRCCRPPSAHKVSAEVVASTSHANTPSADHGSRRPSTTQELMRGLQRARELDGTGQMPLEQGLGDNTRAFPSTPFAPVRTGYARGLTGQRRLQEHQPRPTSGDTDSLGRGRRQSVPSLPSVDSVRQLVGCRSHAHGQTDGSAAPPQPPQRHQQQALVGGSGIDALSTVCFALPRYTVAAAWGEAVVVLSVSPPCAQRVIVAWRAQQHAEGEAEHADAAGAHAERAPPAGNVCKWNSGETIFEPGQATALVSVPFDPAAVPRAGHATLSVRVVSAEVAASVGAAPPGVVCVGFNRHATVTVVGADAPAQPARGALHFALGAIACEESCGTVTLIVAREGGVDGVIRAKYKTCDGTAKAGKDYVATSGVVSLAPGMDRAEIAITIVDDAVAEEDETFTCVLSAVEPAQLVEGGNTICTVKILDDDSWRERLRRSKAQLRSALATTFYTTDTWWDKFSDALRATGGTDDETGEELPPTMTDAVLHVISLFWKVQFALVPPDTWGGGWPAFFVSLVFIGIWTAVVGEVATLFGCVCGLGDAVTAISFVALGTSLPDTFASRLATLHDETADAAIGNITGSNSVNVFLGLGIPWLIGAIYHRVAPAGKGQFDVPAGSLAFSIVLFTVLAMVALVTLLLRRAFIGGELGGSRKWAMIHSAGFVALWLLYIVLASMNDRRPFASL